MRKVALPQRFDDAIAKGLTDGAAGGDPTGMADDRAAVGRRGERIAAALLRLHGYRVLARNFHCPEGELDIVARRGRCLVILDNFEHLIGQQIKWMMAGEKLADFDELYVHFVNSTPVQAPTIQQARARAQRRRIRAFDLNCKAQQGPGRSNVIGKLEQGRIIRRENPDADVVFWTYNWGWCPEKDRLAFIRSLPDDARQTPADLGSDPVEVLHQKLFERRLLASPQALQQ